MNEIELKDIKHGKRHRKDLGDITALAKSIETVGLLHPVVITEDNTLVAGQRRLAACALLGWQRVPVRVVNLADIVKGEFAENSDRKTFSPLEIDAITRAMAPIVSTPVGRPKIRVNNPNKKGKTSEKIGAFAGVSASTVQKIAKVARAAESNPERFGHLAEEMDKSGSVNSAYRKLRQANDEQEILSVKPVVGKYKTIAIDPPWDYEWLSLAGRAAPGYATMTHDELLALPVESWAEENAHIYLWTTNNFMTRACELMAKWGFQHKTILTWVKPRIGLGSYFRNSTEHVLFGVRGELRTRSDSIATHFEAPVTEHSAKPDIFYDIVERSSYPTYLEAFCRTPREGWDAWGNVTKEAAK